MEKLNKKNFNETFKKRKVSEKSSGSLARTKRSYPELGNAATVNSQYFTVTLKPKVKKSSN